MPKRSGVRRIVLCLACSCGGEVIPPRSDASIVDAAPEVAADAHDAGCSPGQIICDGACVAEGPLHCGPTCAPCVATMPFFQASCVKGECSEICDSFECGGACIGPTDDQNCGACGRTCGLGSCAQSICVAEPVESGVVTAFAVDDTNVYYNLLSTGEVRMAAANGGASTQIIPTWVAELALDATSVYWSDAYNAIHKQPLDGGVTTDLGTIIFGGFIVYGNTIYGGGSAMVYQMPTSGGTPTLFASTIHYTGLAVDATDVYVAGEGLVRLSRSDATPTTLIGTTTSVEALAIDDQTIFYVEYPAGVFARDKATAATTTLDSSSYGLQIVLDDTSIYFVDSCGRRSDREQVLRRTKLVTVIAHRTSGCLRT